MLKSLIIMASGLLFSVGGIAAHAGDDVPDAYLSDFPQPDSRIMKAAENGLENYRQTRRFSEEWDIRIEREKGLIETNWFPEHKGEVKLKVQIVVWGDSFRVDAWQQTGWFFPSTEKTDWSRRIERYIQDTIQAELTTTATINNQD